MTEYERECYWSDRFNELPMETRNIVLAVMRAERARDLRRLKDDLRRTHEQNMERLDDLIGRIERDLQVTHPLPSKGSTP